MDNNDLMILVDGVARHRYNAVGNLIDITDEGLVRFWRWFNNSKAVDSEGRPMVVFHGTNAMAYSSNQRIEEFHTHSRGGAFFSSSKAIAYEYGEEIYAAYLRIENIIELDAMGAGWSNISTQVPVNANITDKLLQAKQQNRQEADEIYEALFEETVPATDKSDSAIYLNKLQDLPGLGADTVETDTIAKAAKTLGYGGVIIRNVIDSPTSDNFYSRTPSTIFVSNQPENIKSVEGYGHWEPGDTQFFSPNELLTQPKDASAASPDF